MADPENYTVGWICSTSTEAVAARLVLDERHEAPDLVAWGDKNVYTLGKIGRHNVVIAVLPDEDEGLEAAASVAAHMSNSFHNIRIGLMVGTAGGAPGAHDIRLGDVVVSSPRGGYGGVFQYDFGKTVQGRDFEHTRFLNQPPELLRSALVSLEVDYEIDGHRIEETISSILDKNPTLSQRFQRPQPHTDRLYKSDISHDAACTTVCSDDPSTMIQRPERDPEKFEDDVTIHHGLIASANRLMRDALARDQLAAENDVLCFERGAAGLVNRFPCLVICGISDYADSHATQEWQGYAAMTAAVFAKDLLGTISPNKIQSERKILPVMSGNFFRRVTPNSDMC